MNKAEDFKTIEEFNAEILKDLPLVAFSRWFELGSLVEDLEKQSRRLKNNTLPNNKLGLYIMGVKLPGSEEITMIYFGIAVGPKSGGVRNRATAHFSYSQNDGAGRESGLLAAARALGLVGTYYASYYGCEDPEICDRIESVVLYKYDFICNYEKKRVRARRIPDLVKLLSASEMAESEEEQEEENVIEVPATVTADSVKSQIREQLSRLPIRKSRQGTATVSTPASTAGVAVAAVETVAVAYCGCGKTHKANRCNVTIICCCGTTFKFS